MKVMIFMLGGFFLYLCPIFSAPISSLQSVIHHSKDTFFDKHDKLNLPTSTEIENATKLQYKYSIIFNIPLEELYDSSLLQFIDQWYGVKYVHGGNSTKGVDCSGFTQILLDKVFHIQSARTVPGQYVKCDKIDKSQLQLGDLLFFQTEHKSHLSHVAFYLGHNKFIHASVNKGVSVDDLDNNYYKKIYRCTGRPQIQ